MKNSEKPINPIVNADGYPSFDRAIENEPTSLIGLTKREYFAAKAMQGLLSIYDTHNDIVPNETNIKYMAKLSVTAADALLTELAELQSE